MELTNRHKDNGISPANSMRTSPEMFDGQAGLFEKRAGLPEECCHEIAKSVLEIGVASPADLIVEVGAGTGQVGKWFRAPVHYAGFDLSAGMLNEFRRRVDSNSDRRILIQADANASWPIADGVARIIFSSRAMHLLQQEHAANEVLRIASSDGATLILGRVERKPESIRARMSKEMNERLRRHGFVGRRGELRNNRLFELCCGNGAIELEPFSVAKWKTFASPQQSIESWRTHTHLGGIQVPAATRADILRELEVWAAGEFGGLAREIESEETYVLKSLRLPRTHGKRD